MLIISHRGYWKTRSEMNSIIAFKRALINGFGIETDVRDYCGALVISHDIPTSESLKFEDFIESYNNLTETISGSNKPWLALNIKSDGLQKKIKTILEKNRIINYFVFDMSVPDMLSYAKNNVDFFIRQSEFEPYEKNISGPKGVWLDQFKSTWFDHETLEMHCNNHLHICLVSPELHSRDYVEFWNMIKNFKSNMSNNLMVCTDKPALAEDFFNGK